MGVGTITAEEVFSERVELQPRTSDPSGTEEGEAWIRSDIAPDSNQIATLCVDTGGSTIDVPILQAGTATDGVVEALRLSVGGTLGYVPAIPESKAAFPALRLQHNGQVYGWHDARGETAFFDVAITATNSPVDDGETLTVDYSVQNTGGSINDTQDIRLDVGSSERDRDSDVTVASGASTTGQLSWAAASQGDYTASVLSDDDSASTSVSVESAIPDSRLSRYKFEQDVTDSWGTNDGTNNGGTFTTTAKVNDYALDLTSSDYVDLFTPPTLSEFTVSVWQYLDTVPSSGRFDFFSYQVSTSEAFTCGDDPENGGIDFYTRPSGNLAGFNNGPGRSNLSTGWNFWTFVYDGTDYIIYIDATEVARTSGEFDSNVSGSAQLGNTGGNNIPNYGAIVDDERFYDKGLTSSEVSNLMTTGSING